MISNILLQSQKNEILILIEKAGLKPSFFEWVHVESKYFSNSKISKINYKNTDFYYTFDMNGETHYAVYSPAESSYIGTDYPGVWAKQKKCFVSWLNHLIKEDNEPDLWKSITSETPKLYNNQTYSASPTFKSPDRETMSGKLDQLLEKNNKTKEINQKSSGFIIKRYYGKA